MVKPKLQPAIDELLIKVETTGKLNKDEHVTGNVFHLIQNDENLLKQYLQLCKPYNKPDAVNNMIGKRIRQNWKGRTGKSISAKDKTTLAKTYKLLY